MKNEAPPTGSAKTAADHLQAPSSDSTSETPLSNAGDATVSHGDGVSHSDKGEITYPIVQVEFDRVKTPLIIGVWILSASIAKIGKHMLLVIKTTASTPFMKRHKKTI